MKEELLRRPANMTFKNEEWEQVEEYLKKNATVFNGLAKGLVMLAVENNVSISDIEKSLEDI